MVDRLSETLITFGISLSDIAALGRPSPQRRIDPDIRTETIDVR